MGREIVAVEWNIDGLPANGRLCFPGGWETHLWFTDFTTRDERSLTPAAFAANNSEFHRYVISERYFALFNTKYLTRIKARFYNWP